MLFRKKADERIKVEVSPELISDVGLYIDRTLEKAPEIVYYKKLSSERYFLSESEDAFEGYDKGGPQAYAPPPVPETLADRIKNLDEPFMPTLFHLIDEKEMKDSEVYKRANIDRRLFSKMRKNRAYVPSFRTALALAVSLELDLEQTTNLLMKAGYSMSRSKKFDVIVEFFISHGKYNIFEINEVLYYYNQALLGG